MDAPSESKLGKHFDFLTRESAIYKLWETAGVFSPETCTDQSAPVFNLCMPPPNANGELHLGHSFGESLMDILARFYRLQGYRVLMLPGKDHAGIQTQVVYEQKLKKEGVDYRNTPTEQLYKNCFDFCIDRAKYMQGQEMQLGVSADWSKELFTLDPRLNDIVFETFEKMWADGLIYRGNRIINWSVFSQTAISDVEIEYKEQKGSLWYIRYPWVGSVPSASAQKLKLPNGTEVSIGDGGLVVATTRPETLLGDTALAVNPEDARYSSFIGKEVLVPTTGRKIKVIADRRIDKEFGTGVVKVTPAHDFADYDIGQDHKLEAIQVIGKSGQMTELAGADFAGLTTLKCREKLIAQLTEQHLLLDTTQIVHKVPIGERGKDVIEPLISEQWFVAVDKPGNSLRQRALDLIQSGKIKVHPERFRGLFVQWLNNLRDWNISRQIWWGHRMPVWYRGDKEKPEIRVGRNAPEGEGWWQETDTFDTWFSSGQWAYSTMAAHGFIDLNNYRPNEYFPTHTMVMGRDILLFWACRMLLMTVYRVNDAPWRNIFFTGLIRDEHGQKMSKSKGNGIEPLETIKKYGTDALRLSVIMGASPGNDINLSERKFEGYSKFRNKLWNAAKLLELRLATRSISQSLPPEITVDANRWILTLLGRLQQNVTQKLLAYELSIAADELYNFTWQTFCDWYLEMAKLLLENGTPAEQEEVGTVAAYLFRQLLIMLHPFMPYVTEELYQSLPFLKRNALLATEKWSTGVGAFEGESNIALVQEIVSGIRSVKAALTIPQKKIRAALPPGLSSESTLLIRELARVELCDADAIAPTMALRKPYSGGVVILEVEGKDRYRAWLEKELLTLTSTSTALEAKLGGSFASQAKPDIVEQERERLAAAKRSALEIKRELAGLDALK